MNWCILILGTFLIVSVSANYVNETFVSDFTLQDNDYKLQEFEDYSATTRILGGEIATPNQFPFLVGLVVWLLDKRSWCGGSIITDQFVLTAAHCLDRTPSVSVIFGAHDRSNSSEEGRYRREVTQENFILHALWNSKTLESDLGLILFEPKILLNDQVQPIALPYGEYETQFYDNYLALTSGWGRYQKSCKRLSQHVRYFQARILHNTECMRFYPKYVRTNHICMDGSKGRMGCEGDSGGPLFININGTTPMLIGVLSFSKCCDSKHPTAFTRITQYLSWIDKYTNESEAIVTNKRKVL